ncbi:pilus assembly protein N-terminal domain-containing protein [Halomonas sp. CH40]
MQGIKLISAFIIALAMGMSTFANAQTQAVYGAQEYVEVYVGSVTTVETGFVERIAVGNDGVLQASVLDENNLLLLGRTPGVSELVVWTEDGTVKEYKVRVYGGPVADNINVIKAILQSFPNVTVNDRLGQTVLSGTVKSTDFERFQAVIGNFPSVLSLVKPERNVEIEETIAFDVVILELSRNYQHSLGIRWEDTAAGPALGVVGNIIPNNNFGVTSGGEVGDLLNVVGSGASRLEGYFGVSSILRSQLQLLQEEGVARILAEPSLSTVTDEEASFLVGGDFPVAILNEFGQPVVEFRQYGIQLEIEPTMDRNHNIRSRIRTEVSNVDFSVEVNGVPGLRRRESTSTITARPGQTIIISGLLNTSDSRTRNKLPLLGDIPILGALFKSSSWQQGRTELVIAVTPRIQQPGTPLQPNMQEALREGRGVLEGSDVLDASLMD